MTVTVAFLGLGNMGGPMAANLVKAGNTVRGFDPVPDAVAKARANGVTVCDTAVEAVTGAAVVITMLPSGRHVLDAYADILPACSPGTLLVDSSTIEVSDAVKAAEAASAAGHQAVDAPVSGGTMGAEAATLTFMAGGTAEAFAQAEPLLRQMGARVIHCGDPGAGQAAKICNNMILGISMIAVSEAFVLGAKLGLSEQALFEVASTSSGNCWALNTNCPVPGPVPKSPANREYAGGFASQLMLKDLRLSQDAARAQSVNTALGRAATEMYEKFVAEGGLGKDFSAIITAIRDTNPS